MDAHGQQPEGYRERFLNDLLDDLHAAGEDSLPLFRS
jgi:hypothetical protein